MNLEQLKEQRKQIRAKNTRMQSFLNLASEDIEKRKQVEHRLSSYRSLLEDFEKCQQQIDILDPSEDDADEYTTFEDSYFATLARATDLLATMQIQKRPSLIQDPNSPTSSHISESHSVNSFKLPTINLPTFNGTYASWLSFRDIYKSIIHDNEHLSKVQKLHYLKSCLKDGAAEVIAALPTTDSNYDIAWDMLSKRYENKKLLVKTHVDNILDLPNIAKESAASLRNLLDGLLRHLRALQSLEEPTDEWGTLLVYILLRKLDQTSRRAWEMRDPSSELPTFSETLEYKTTSEPSLTSKVQRFKSFATTQPQCTDCGGNHRIYSCEVFAARNQEERLSRVRELKLCINCMHLGHSVVNCRSDPCRKCKRRHHTLLHRDTVTAATTSTEENEIDEVEQSEAVALFTNNCQQVLLSTAIVLVRASNGRLVRARALLDSGSQATFITKSLQERLNCSTTQANAAVIGISGNSILATNATTVLVKSQHNQFQINLNCFIMPSSIAKRIPSFAINRHSLHIPAHLQLADATFYKPDDIDILLGADVFYQLHINEAQIRLGPGMPTLQKTHLGWVIAGIVNQFALSTMVKSYHTQLEDQLAKFWAMEDLPECNPLTSEKLFVENHFVETTRRDVDGRFIVTIPLREEAIVLGDSYNTAFRRLRSMERKFIKNPQLKQQYSLFMANYKDSNYMTLVDKNDDHEDDTVNYLPHHAVINNSSLTTKLRVVFDAYV